MRTTANHMQKGTTIVPAEATDIQFGGWLRILPPLVRRYGFLARWDRPVGIWLLLWPSLWGLLLAHKGHPPVWQALVFCGGAIAMRGAGCTVNDILDRRFDASVARTAQRPLPAGTVSVPAAWAWLMLQLLAAALFLLSLPPTAWFWGFAAMPLVLLYPLMKRITWWPQVWLGLVFNWGLWLGLSCAVVTHETLLAGMCLYCGALCWTVGYDTIYSTQDAADDAVIGVRSTARLFGRHVATAVAYFYGAAVFFWATGMAYAFVSPWAAVWAVPAGVFLTCQYYMWSSGSLSARKAFVNNTRVGAAVALGLALGYVF